MSCYVIVTCRSLLWTLLSIAAALANLAALMTAQWLVGQPRKAGVPGGNNINASRQTSPEEYYRPTIGIYNRCTSLHYFGEIFHDSCGPYITSFSDLPSNFWKATLVFMGMGILLLVIVVFTSLLGFCVHAIGKKSIFNISGLLQAIAGLFLIIALVLYPAGWGTDRVQDLCGYRASPYYINECTLGWAFYCAVGGTLLSFVCAILSVQADIATSSDKVEDEILEGKNLICLL
ncbi:PREDICTED: lipoma HMGIC fusion partner-like 2 protein [Branchiostoma belcheri]|uniref:Lipoma HMGIC fusion partner-like 2 protein n=1 Tax=Branchiostoma belcheri TaxID=7741 RepID=A0A6P4YDJ0_BRABE|nr:PREDICTED: lipoma HMGIC fusion partner-like 2 protein [Branchiostoma belcheri]XP_019622502.1 PREDICTED: lipoma HMGIC fusion partner-like 2 protein [Branchiostoma belcheri]XP_019622503.1 PREDICTED: lipoma HMGIC fusion partner-like 2 protein [Branchiostoma belcheri]XP_019622504.1 PREDICTED: lipoma HMGIC fusion partner-like 2 protein [Branchiostoma belcheri]KAI8503311.1 positive regulation of fertilization [Branchiostoma belcheri]